jgi:hypothetical protein
MPTAPTVFSITFDQSSYTPGSLITATVTYTKGMSDMVNTLTGTATDPVTGLQGHLDQTFTVANQITDTTTPSVSDLPGRTWTKQSDTGAVAVFTATA